MPDELQGIPGRPREGLPWLARCPAVSSSTAQGTFHYLPKVSKVCTGNDSQGLGSPAPSVSAALPWPRAETAAPPPGAWGPRGPWGSPWFDQASHHRCTTTTKLKPSPPSSRGREPTPGPFASLHSSCQRPHCVPDASSLGAMRLVLQPVLCTLVRLPPGSPSSFNITHRPNATYLMQQYRCHQESVVSRKRHMSLCLFCIHGSGTPR